MHWPQLPDYGCFPRWPQDGHLFIHPEDVSIATRCLPSERLLRRDQFDGEFYHYSYGELRFRLRPCLWLQVRDDGIDIGDPVETVGLAMERELFVAEVWGMYFVRRKGCVLYRLRRFSNGGETQVPKLFSAAELRLTIDKTSVRPGMTVHPAPRWQGNAGRGDGIEF